ncbi:MAG: hypothetical protein LBJ64_10615 [Deltaproteobacteria bacterium]|jgi:hypothetical protein|nr:hypothetical protein [Deltaproteobacteria bacterium]
MTNDDRAARGDFRRGQDYPTLDEKPPFAPSGGPSAPFSRPPDGPLAPPPQAGAPWPNPSAQSPPPDLGPSLPEKIPREKLSPGLVYSSSLSVLSRRLPSALYLGFPSYVAAFGSVVVAWFRSGSTSIVVMGILFFILAAVLALCHHSSTADFVYRLEKDGRDVPVRGSLIKGLNCLSAVVPISVIILGLSSILFGVVAFVYDSSGDSVGVSLFFFFSLVVAFLLFLLFEPFLLALAVCGVERLPALECLNRAFNLSSGQRLRIFAALLPLTGASVFVGYLLVANDIEMSARKPFFLLVIVFLYLFSTVASVILAEIYCQLRIIGESQKIAKEAVIFDRRF